jgi:hypothetical protein
MKKSSPEPHEKKFGVRRERERGSCQSLALDWITTTTTTTHSKSKKK